jgi:serine/threonine-protein kinase
MSGNGKDPAWTAVAATPLEPATLDHGIDTALPEHEASELGSRVGPWTLRRLLGRGGMGAVYLAERSNHDFQQRAALKLIKLGMDSGEILQRFLAERRILARLEHPNIARLIDGGVDDRGRPYFVMEWIDGLPLLDYATAATLDLRARVALFLKLCDAVAYAHRQLVVHRDLKPGNVLVDTRGEPKLLDFGIAKLLQDDNAQQTSATGARFFTRAYAAPEQIRGEPVSTATDVYALGSVLFELLTGTALHSARALRQDTSDMLAAARRRAGDAGPSAIAPRALAGDVALIVAKAVRDEPMRRYAGAEALADDLRAWLDDRPIRARPDALSYRLMRSLRRHWLAVVTGSATLIAILGGAGVAIWQARIARDEALRAEMTSSFLASVFESATPEAGAGGDITARSLLERGRERIERELAGQPKVQARLYGTLGRSYFYIGDYARAAEMYEAGRARVDADDPLSGSELLRGLAQAELAAGQLTLARTHINQALALWQRSRRDPLARVQIASVEKSVLGMEGQTVAARDLAQAVHADLSRLLGPEHEQTLQALNDYGTWMLESGDASAALPIFDQVIALRQRVSGADHPELGTAMHNRQLCLLRLGRVDEARTQAVTALALRERILPPQHRDLARSLGALGVIEARLGRFAEALELHQRAIEVLRSQRRPDLLLLGLELTNAGVDAYQAGALARARELLDEALERLTPQLGPDDPRVLSAASFLGLVQLHAGELDQAETHLRAILARESANPAASASSRLATLRYLARALRWQGRASSALALFDSNAASELLASTALSNNDRARTEIEWALVLMDLSDWPAASLRLDAAARVYGTIDAASAVDRALWLLARARLDGADGNWQSAWSAADAARQIYLQLRGAQHWDTLEASALAAEATWHLQPSSAHRRALGEASANFAKARPWHPEAKRLAKLVPR